MKSNNFPADFIVIGSGLGGLTTAAYLARANYRVIVLEKNFDIGGKCTTRIVNGNRYVIGANTFGSRTAFVLNNLGIKIEWIPACLSLHGKDGYLSFPLSFSSISELKSFGMDFFSFIKMCSRLGRSMLGYSPEKKTYRDCIDHIIKEPQARELLYLEAWYLGTHPDWLPASALKLFLGTYYGYHKPIYPAQGAHAIPNALAKYIKARGGEVLTGQKVTKIGIEKGKVQGVEIGKQWITAKRGVISNAELGQTIAMLDSKSKVPLETINDSGLKTAFPFALLLLTLDAAKAPAVIARPSASLETNALILTRPICELIEELETGRITNFPVCNLVLSDLKAQLLNGARLSQLPVHISILWPKSSKANINLNAITKSILSEVEKIYPGFTESILSSQWITPLEYEKRFGFSSNPAPVLDTPTYIKHSWELPVKGLYNVGTTVLPAGSHTGTAIESGIRCAEDILACI